MLPLEVDKEDVKERTAVKVLALNELLTRLELLLVQIKAENNSYKLKREIRQIL